jgi:hypothetical protein
VDKQRLTQVNIVKKSSNKYLDMNHKLILGGMITKRIRHTPVLTNLGIHQYHEELITTIHTNIPKTLVHHKCIPTCTLKTCKYTNHNMQKTNILNLCLTIKAYPLLTKATVDR